MNHKLQMDFNYIYTSTHTSNGDLAKHSSKFQCPHS